MTEMLVQLYSVNITNFYWKKSRSANCWLKRYSFRKTHKLFKFLLTAAARSNDRTRTGAHVRQTTADDTDCCTACYFLIRPFVDHRTCINPMMIFSVPTKRHLVSETQTHNTGIKQRT